ncbi:type IV pilus modification protein PilV [Vreelandella malpeensis]|uniref:Type IV pilus modification protein PilV n=1 Tax=Vreelandella malpeensis TaxID=1172368 RepID=A0ABS8DSF6_9GAMM|nr:type IV pilus modification protein PilV [Halomonas malpeensis]MCB8889193.1 type IV pilus modification protein PilV [Halomonas malpeensis]
MKKQQGLSLIESLVAMLIMAVGLLGVAKLQTEALTQQRSAYLETQATNMAQDMMDRIRANRDLAGAYTLAFGQNVSGTGLAARDKREWAADVATVLPQGQGAISVAQSNVSVTVRFTDIVSPSRPWRVVQLASEL